MTLQVKVQVDIMQCRQADLIAHFLFTYVRISLSLPLTRIGRQRNYELFILQILISTTQR